jgi:type IV secretory pathway VirB2 component (pilin)
LSPVGGQTGGGAIGDALFWAESALLGTTGTVVAIIAVAMLGYGMLFGRIDLRRSVSVVLGCFIIFGSHAIVSGVIAAVGEDGGGQASREPTLTPGESDLPPAHGASPAPVQPADKADPFAGAAVPSS